VRGAGRRTTRRNSYGIRTTGIACRAARPRELRLPAEEAAILRRLFVLPLPVLEFAADVLLPAAMELHAAHPRASVAELAARIDGSIRATLERYRVAYPNEVAMFLNAVRTAPGE